jgi:hypothetical protein
MSRNGSPGPAAPASRPPVESPAAAGQDAPGAARLQLAAASGDQVRSLTVVPPWSLPIVQGHKPTENRTRNIAGSWRGRILILSSAGRWEDWAAEVIADLTGGPRPTRSQCRPGCYIGAVTLVDVHHSDGACCAPWGEPDVWHLVLDDAVTFAEPIRATGHLGLRRVTDRVLIHAALTRPDTATASSVRSGGNGS